MGYTHNKGFAATESGFAVGDYGSEIEVIGNDRSVTLGGTKIAPTNKVNKIAKVALAAADTGGGVLAWQNPESSSIVITRLVVDVTTKSTAACTVDFGTTETNATTSSDTLLDGVDVGTAAGTFDNITDKGTNGKSRQKLASGKWVTGSMASGAAAGLAGYAYIEYFLI
jgi:hypothetical protein